MKDIEARVIKNEPIASGIYELVVELGQEDIGRVQPGQFAQLQVSNAPQLLLRRPISINSYDETHHTMTFAYQVKGEGTAMLARISPGQQLKVLGSLGNGFWPKPSMKKIYAVGGGIGVAPLKYCLEKWPQIAWKAYLGFRSAEFVYQLSQWQALCPDGVTVATEDGSLGLRGFATQPLAEALENDDRPDMVIACGPLPMLKALQKIALQYPDIPFMASLEERMGCGIGACLVCNCKIRTTEGEQTYRRVCADGPVFPLREVIFE